MSNLKVNRSLTIPSNELIFRFSRSSGPGGQHVNKSSTKVEVAWNVQTSAVLGPRQRARITNKLRTRIDSTGHLRVISDRSRSQMRNRDDALRRLADIVARALLVDKKRVASQPTTASKERRLAAKRMRSDVKRARRPVMPSDD